VRTLEKLTEQRADTLARAITELRAAGDIESAEAEVYAARTSADQRVATAEARLAEEIQCRWDTETGRDAARAARQVADATARAEQAQHDAEQAHRAEVAAIEHAHQAQAAAAEETTRIRADHQRALDQFTTATNARINALEETCDACAPAPNEQKPTLTPHAPRTSASRHNWPRHAGRKPTRPPTAPRNRSPVFQAAPRRRQQTLGHPIPRDKPTFT
jgi:hypothetical protein